MSVGLPRHNRRLVSIVLPVVAILTNLFQCVYFHQIPIYTVAGQIVPYFHDSSYSGLESAK